MTSVFSWQTLLAFALLHSIYQGHICLLPQVSLDFPGGSHSKASGYNAGDPGSEDPLKKEMATHSSILAWKIP